MQDNNPVFKMAEYISRRIYLSADRIACQSSSFLPYLENTLGIDAAKLVYIPAFADEAYVTNDFVPEGDVVDFVFLGNLGIAQDLFSVLKAIKEIRDLPNIKVHFVGDGTCLEEMKKFVRENGIHDIVKFYGRRPVEEMPKYYKLADACLVSLKADNATGLTLPAKVQGYMAAGKPIIAMIDGSARDVIEKAECGICVRAGDIDGLAKGMRDFAINRNKYENCGKKAREYFLNHFNKNSFMKKIEKEMNILCS